MQKFYYRLIIIIVVLGLIINIISFSTNLNKKQIINSSFFMERGEAEAYLLKHIIVESGIYLKNTKEDKIDNATKIASKKYSVDEKLLKMIVKTNKEFNVGIVGGMGLSGICPAYFHDTEFNDPYNYEQNIFSAAETIKKLMNKGISRNNLPAEFILCKNENKIKAIHPSIEKKAIQANETYAGTINANH